MNTEQQSKPNFFRFDDLRIYHKALSYVEFLYSILKKCKTDDEVALKHKIISKAENIAICIAEGACRGKTQFVFHLKQSKTAVRECYVLITIAKNLGIISEEQEEESKGILFELSKMNRALITSLQKNHRKSPHKNREEDEDDGDCEENFSSDMDDTNIYSDLNNY